MTVRQRDCSCRGILQKWDYNFSDQCLLSKAKPKCSICLLYKPFGFAWQCYRCLLIYEWLRDEVIQVQIYFYVILGKLNI